MRKKSEMGGGVIQFSNYTPPNPTSPPYPIKNERSLKLIIAFVHKRVTFSGVLLLYVRHVQLCAAQRVWI